VPALRLKSPEDVTLCSTTASSALRLKLPTVALATVKALASLR
jgi:hypothetical protein